jgi:hypothetical protein
MLRSLSVSDVDAYPRRALLLIVVLDSLLLSTLLFPWRQLAIGTAHRPAGIPLSLSTTARDIQVVGGALAGQTLLRTASELLVLGSALVLLAACSRTLFGYRMPTKVTLIVGPTVCIILTGVAAFILPAMHPTAGLTVFVTTRATLFTYLAFGSSCALWITAAVVSGRARALVAVTPASS